MKQVVGYIDRLGRDERVINGLARHDIETVYSRSLCEFENRFGFDDYSLLLVHVGNSESLLFPTILRKNPTLRLVGIAPPSTVGEYVLSDLPFYSYDATDALAELIKDEEGRIPTAHADDWKPKRSLRSA